VAWLAQEALQRNPRASRRLISALRLVPAFRHQTKPRVAAREAVVHIRRPLGPSVLLRQVTDLTSDALSQALELYATCFPGDDEFTVDQIRVLIGKGDYRLFILTRDDLPDRKTVAGMLLLMPYAGGKFVNLEYCAVAESCRSKGLGTIMMRLLLLHLAQEQDASVQHWPRLLTLECKQCLVSFYTKHGCFDTKLKPNVFQQLNSASGLLEPTPLYFLAAYVSSHSGQLVFTDAALKSIREALVALQQNLRRRVA